jgi:RNA polymerase sigma-70 factor (ECF subfamily)
MLDLERCMERYQQADPDAPVALVGALSPALLRFFRSQAASREQADDLLQETWLRIHRVRHTYRPGEPLLPWVYAIARRVRVDGYRRTRRVTLHETAMEVLPERPAQREPRPLPAFESLVAALPEAQREVVTMLKVGGLSLEEVARATVSTVGAVKQKAHRAYERLRKLLEIQREAGLDGGAP